MLNNRTKMHIAIALIVLFAVMECGAAVAVYSVVNTRYEEIVGENVRNDSLSIPNTERNDNDSPVDSRGGGGVPYNGISVDDPLMREVNGFTVTGGLTSADFSSYEAYEEFSSHKKEELDSLTREDFASAKSYEIFMADYRTEVPPPVVGGNDSPGEPWAGPDL